MFEVHVEKGHKHGSKVVFRGEAGRQDAEMEPGDVIFVLEAKQHKTFRRIASDLIIERVCHILNYFCLIVSLKLQWIFLMTYFHLRQSPVYTLLQTHVEFIIKLV